MLEFDRDIMHSFEGNKNFQFFVKKKCSAYEEKLYNGANSQPVINMVEAFGVDIHSACIRFHVPYYLV